MLRVCLKQEKCGTFYQNIEMTLGCHAVFCLIMPYDRANTLPDIDFLGFQNVSGFINAYADPLASSAPGRKMLNEKNVLVIGAGGVSQVVVHKCAQHNDVLGKISIASRKIEKCRAIADSVAEKGILKYPQR